MTSSDFVREALRDPLDRSALVSMTDDRAVFAGGKHYPCVGGRPILIDEASSLFSIADVLARKRTTQDRHYRDTRQLKNFIRRRLLPPLTWDRHKSERYARLASTANGKPVLVLGSGDRVDEYRAMFHASEVVASDVHLQFGADAVLDAHRIPFADRSFGLILAAQVLEHTARPWVVAAEMQRVTQIGGVIHVEVPFEFPYHSAPYDFYRFTPSALRFLFATSDVLEIGVTEGRFSSAAVFLSSAVVDSFAGRRARQLALASTRLGLWWMKYLDAQTATYPFKAPKGLYVSLRVDGIERGDRQLLEEVVARCTTAE